LRMRKLTEELWNFGLTKAFVDEFTLFPWRIKAITEDLWAITVHFPSLFLFFGELQRRNKLRGELRINTW